MSNLTGANIGQTSGPPGEDREKRAAERRFGVGFLFSLAGRAFSGKSAEPARNAETARSASPATALRDRDPGGGQIATPWHEVLKQRREAEEQQLRARLAEQQERERARWRQAASGEMTAEHAREVLGVKADAGPEEIQAAYEAMMNSAFPDVRGSAFLSKLVTSARDLLLARNSQ